MSVRALRSSNNDIWPADFDSMKTAYCIQLSTVTRKTLDIANVGLKVGSVGFFCGGGASQAKNLFMTLDDTIKWRSGTAMDNIERLDVLPTFQVRKPAAVTVGDRQGRQ